MKTFLIQYDLDYNGYKNLLMLIHANTFYEAELKLKKEIKSAFGGEKSVIKTTNLTIE